MATIPPRAKSIFPSFAVDVVAVGGKVGAFEVVWVDVFFKD